MHLLGHGAQFEIAVIVPVETRLGIATHQRLQQYAAGHLQASPGEKTFDRHDLAARNAVEVRGNALDLGHARQAHFQREGR